MPAEDTGMVVATSWEPSAYEHYTFPFTQWSAEIRFPIRQTPGYWTKAGGYPTSHGGQTPPPPAAILFSLPGSRPRVQG